MRLFEGSIKIEKVLHYNERYFVHILMQNCYMIFISKLQNVENYKYEIIQNNFTEIRAVKDGNFCVFLRASQVENVP